MDTNCGEHDVSRGEMRRTVFEYFEVGCIRARLQRTDVRISQSRRHTGPDPVDKLAFCVFLHLYWCGILQAISLFRF